jgi:hypothetical protein
VTAPVVGIDIDGSLGAYHDHFVWFLNTIYFPDMNIQPRWSLAMRGEFSDALRMPKDEYRRAKLAFRQGGLKRCLPQFPVDIEKDGIHADIQYIRSLGIRVIITTKRPWLRLDNIDPDTQYWLDENVGEVDGVIYDDDKHLALIESFGLENILGILDDLPDVIERAVELGIPTVLRRGAHNHWWLVRERDRLPVVVPAVTRLKDFTHHVEEWKEDWDAQHSAVV